MSIHEKKTIPNQLRIFILIAAAFLLFGVLSGLRASTSIIAASLSEWTGLSYGEVSIAFSVMNIVLGISGPVFGLLTLKFSHSKIMIAGAILASIGFIGTAFINTFPALIIFIGVFFGLGASALCFSIVYAAAVPLIGEKRSAFFGGILCASQGAMSMILAPVIEVGSNIWGMQICLIGIGILALCLVPLSLLFRPKAKTDIITKETKTEKEPVSFKTVLKTMVKTPFFYLLAFGLLAYGFCDGGMINHLFEYSQLFKVSTTYSALLISVYSFAIMMGAIIGGFLCSKIPKKNFVLAGLFLSWACINIIGSLITQNYLSGIILTLLSGITAGSMLPSFTSVAQDWISIERFAAVYSVLYFFIIIAYSLDSFLGGILFDIYKNFIDIDIFVIVLTLISGILFLIVGIKMRKVKEIKKIL